MLLDNFILFVQKMLGLKSKEQLVTSKATQEIDLSDIKFCDNEIEEEVTEKEEESYEKYWWHESNFFHIDYGPIGGIDVIEIYCKVKELLERNKLPPIEIPQTAVKAIQLLNTAQFEFSEVSQLVSHSPTMAGEFLKVVNSPIYNRGHKINDIKLALPLLGATNVKAMLYLYNSKISVASDIALNEMAVQVVDHSYVTGIISMHLSRRYFPDPDIAFLAGLLHDIGKLAIIRTISDYFEMPNTNDMLMEDHFGRVFPDLAPRVGKGLADQWGISPTITSSIEHQYDFDTYSFEEEHKLVRPLSALVNLSSTMSTISGRGGQCKPHDIFESPAAKELMITKNPSTIAFFEQIPELIEQHYSS